MPKKRTPTIAVSRYRMGGCSLARMMSQPESPARATAKRAARVPTAPAAANLAATGASRRRSRAAVEPPAERRASRPAARRAASRRSGSRRLRRPVPGCLTAGVVQPGCGPAGCGRECGKGSCPGGGARAGAAGRCGRCGILDSGGGGRARGAGCHCHDDVGEFPGLPVVGHQQDGDLSAERGDGAADGGGGFPVQVGGGFIEQQHTWLPPRSGRGRGPARRGAAPPG